MHAPEHGVQRLDAENEESPGEHGSHIPAWSYWDTKPTGQSVHEVLCVCANFPAAHTAHVVDKADLVNVPASHAIHTEAPVPFMNKPG